MESHPLTDNRHAHATKLPTYTRRQGESLMDLARGALAKIDKQLEPLF